MDCLSDADIDALIRPLIGDRAMPARMFYDVMRGHTLATRMAEDIKRRVAIYGWVVIPIHTRHHWATAVARMSDTHDAVAVTVLDSAPSPATRRDFQRSFTRLRLRDVTFTSHGKQPRGSNECGLHVVLLALHCAISAQRAPVPQLPPPSTEILCLHEWRSHLHRHIAERSAPTAHVVLQCAPTLARWGLEDNRTPRHSEVQGGARSVRTRKFRISSQPNRLVPPQHATSVIDVDDTASDEAVPCEPGEVPLTQHEVLAVANVADHPDIAAWFAQRSFEHDGNTCVVARRLPPILEHIRPAISDLARRTLHDRRAATAAPSFACFAPGTMLTDTVVDAAITGIQRAASSVHVIQAGDFSLYARVGRENFATVACPQGSPDVAVIIHLPIARHFVLAVYRDADQNIRLFDSLVGSAKVFNISAEVDAMLGRFRHLLQSWGRSPSPWLHVDSCSLQGPNDCGVEAVRNLIAFCVPDADRKQLFSRDAIRNAAHSADPPQALAANIAAALRPYNRSPEPTATTVAQTRDVWTHDPYPLLRERGTPAPVTLDHPTSREIRTQLTRTALGAFFFEAWACDDERGTWLGTLVKHPTPGLPARAEYVAEWCARCAAWHEFQRPWLFELPRRGITYHQLTFDTGSPPAMQPPMPDCDTHLAATDVACETKPVSDHDPTTPRETQTMPPQRPPTLTTGHEGDERSDAAIPQPDSVRAVAPVRCLSCRRHAIADSYCPWHHPRIRDVGQRQSCASKNSLGRHCNELTVACLDADYRTRAFDTRYCWYHASEPERARLRAVLSGTAQPPVTFVPSSQHGKAIPHRDVRNFVAAVAPGSFVAIDLLAPETGWPRSTVIGRVSSHGTRTSASTIEPLARYCDRCEVWHAPDVGSLALPSSDTSYFALQPATAQQIEIASSGELDPECEDSDAGSDDNEADMPDEHSAEPPDLRPWLEDPEREPLYNSAWATPAAVTIDAARAWTVYGNKPPHVHRVTWAAKSPATRKEHVRWLRRIKDAPSELRALPISRGVVELVMRLAAEKHWRWSTIASKLSAARSALRNLPLYTSQLRAIDLSSDAYFTETQQHAQKKARVGIPIKSRPLTFEEFATLKRIAPHELTVLTWWTAARAGDVRRLDPSNVHIDLNAPDEHGFVPVACLFTRGKGAYFWGPYTVHTRMPLADARRVEQRVEDAKRRRIEEVFPITEQRSLARAISGFADASLRSLRRGSLTWFASAGASDNHLQLLSGHRRRDTLLRYLGWGILSSEQSDAAVARTRLIAPHVTGAGIESVPNQHPLWMGFRSGFHGDRGRRVKNEPRLFPLQAPSRPDLLGADPAEDTSGWTLHVKPEIEPIDALVTPQHVRAPDLRAALEQGLAFLHNPSLLGVTWAPLSPAQLPRTAFTPTQWHTIVSGRKAVPLRLSDDKQHLIAISDDGSASSPFKPRSACNGFTVPQKAKRRWRPVFEPLHNSTTETSAYPPLHYPSRQERRRGVAGAKYAVEFDFSAWYDQVALQQTDYYVCRGRPTTVNIAGSPEVFEFFALTRVPMGASFSAHLMQTLTWAILEPIIDGSYAEPNSLGNGTPQTRALTMIDNVALYGDDADDFLRAVQCFVDRCRLFGAQLNETPPYDRDSLLRAAELRRKTPEQPFTFLGEDYYFDCHRGTMCVRNNPKHVTNLHDAFARLQRQLSLDPGDTTRACSDDDPPSRRQVAALVGLATYMAHTVEVPLREHFDVVRLWSRLAQAANAASKWDEPWKPSRHDVDAIGRFIGPLLANVGVVPSSFDANYDLFSIDSYDAAIIVDASGSGLGAFVRFRSGEIVELRQGWSRHIAHSAWAEPRAATLAVQFARDRGCRQLAVITDHSALAYGQRRRYSGNGGFSTAYYLNEFFRTLYGGNGDGHVFYVPGHLNPADAPSRNTMVGDTTRRTRVVDDFVFPGLDSFFHPLWQGDCRRQWWNV